MKPIIYTSPYSDRHNTGDGHPESPARITALEELFQTAPFNDFPQKQSTQADLEHILLAHDEDYVFDLQDKTPDQGLFYLDGDTILSPNSYEAALYSAGAVINAVDDVMAEDSTSIFCATRPPGHHAEPNQALGFCLFNNVFIGARYAQEKYGVKKIAIVDFDVHHGNGTETMTRRHNKTHPDKPILYISTHGHPLFPDGIHGTGDPEDNSDTLLNIRLPNNCESDEFRNTYETQVFSHLEQFKPEILMISAGFDAHIDDPLANMRLNHDDFAFLAQKTNQIAKKHCKNRIISVLEGGYNIPALTKSVQAYLEEFTA